HHDLARPLEASVRTEPDEFGLEVDMFTRERAQQVSREDERAGENRHGDLRLERPLRDRARRVLDTSRDLGFGIELALAPLAAHCVSPASAKRMLRFRASGGGLERRVTNGLWAPGFRLWTPELNIQ